MFSGMSLGGAALGFRIRARISEQAPTEVHNEILKFLENLRGPQQLLAPKNHTATTKIMDFSL